MAQDQLPVPQQGAPLAPLGRVISIGQILTVLTELIKTIGPLFTLQNAIASRLGVLVGDLAVEIPPAGKLDAWLAAQLTGEPSVVRHPQQDGVLSHGETDSMGGPQRWVGLYSLCRNFLYQLAQSLESQVETRTPYFRADATGLVWSYRPDDTTLENDPGKPDLVHILGQIAGLLTIAAQIPYPSYDDNKLIKQETIIDTPPVTWHGSLADVVFSQETTTTTGREVFKNSNILESAP